MVCVISFLALWAIFPSTNSLHTFDRGWVKDDPTADDPTAGQRFIPKTLVPLPDDYDDYSRGRRCVSLFEGGDPLPGKRYFHKSSGFKLPNFDPRRPEKYPQTLLNASKYDPMHKCAPNGECTGHFMYNVYTPELIVFRPRSNIVHSDVAVVVAPGGGGLHLDWETEAISPAQWLNSIGITAFVLKYRVPDPNYRLHEIDGQRAMSLARHLAPHYGINKSRIGFWGSSAGAHMGIELNMASNRAYDDRDEIDEVPWNIDFMILFYPHVPSYKDFTKQLNLPPTVVGYAADDPCCTARRTDLYLFDAYIVNNATSNLMVKKFDKGGHGWSDCDYYPYLWDSLPSLCKFKAMYIQPFFERMFGPGPWSRDPRQPAMTISDEEEILQGVGAEAPNLDAM